MNGVTTASSGLRAVLGNLAHLFSGKAAAGIMSLVYLVIVTHRLGARDYGMLILLNGYVVLVGSLVAFSGFHGVVRFGSIAIEAEDRAEFARLVRFMALIELGCGLFAILVAAAFAPLVGPRLGWSPATIAMAMPFSLAVLGTVRATPQGILQVAGRFDLIGLHQALASPGVRLVGSVAILLGGGGLHAFILVWLVSSIVEGGAMWLLAWPVWRTIVPGEPLVGAVRGALRRHKGLGRFILVTNFDLTLRELAPNLAPLTTGWILGPVAAGLFALAQRATTLLQQPAVLLGQASYAVFAGHVARGERAALRRTTWRSVALALGAAVPLVLLLALFGERLMVLTGGRSFGGGRALIILLAFARGAALASAPLTAALIALGKPQLSLSVGLATNLGFYPLLPPLLWLIGVNGAGVHAIVQNALAAVALGLLFAGNARGDA